MSAAAPALDTPSKHIGTWTAPMLATLTAEYAGAREAGTLRALADKLGVDLYQLYGKAHRLQLAREIRKR